MSSSASFSSPADHGPATVDAPGDLAAVRARQLAVVAAIARTQGRHTWCPPCSAGVMRR